MSLFGFPGYWVCPNCCHPWTQCDCNEEMRRARVQGMTPPTNLQPTEPVTSTVSGRAGHTDQILDWRKSQFLCLGYNLHRASFLADTHIDVRAAEKLRKQGCPLELLERIMLGTDFAGEDERWWNPPEMIDYSDEAVSDAA